MNDAIKQLLTLQERDLQLDKLQADLAAIPGGIEGLKKQIAGNKAALEASKKELTQLQLVKKEREVDLEAKEGVIRKHAGELNAVKTNEAYRALLGEIDKAKQEKSVLEDTILQVMEQIDQVTKAWKQREVTSKTTEGDFLRQISDLETKQKNLEQELAQKKTEREQATAGFAKNLLDQYERLRSKGRRGAGVVPLKGEQCSGCHMRVSPNLINEVRRGLQLMTCESCSRIVYLEEVSASPS